MSDLLAYAKELLDKLTTKSSSLNWKVEDIQKDVSTLKCGFDCLKEDVAVLDSASSELLHLSSEIGPCLEEHSQQTEKQLPNITKLVEDKKSSANILEEFTHPCGGSGWKLAIYHDFVQTLTLPVHLSGSKQCIVRDHTHVEGQSQIFLDVELLPFQRLEC